MKTIKLRCIILFTLQDGRIFSIDSLQNEIRNDFSISCQDVSRAYICMSGDELRVLFINMKNEEKRHFSKLVASKGKENIQEVLVYNYLSIQAPC